MMIESMNSDSIWNPKTWEKASPGVPVCFIFYNQNWIIELFKCHMIPFALFRKSLTNTLFIENMIKENITSFLLYFLWLQCLYIYSSSLCLFFINKILCINICLSTFPCFNNFNSLLTNFIKNYWLTCSQNNTRSCSLDPQAFLRYTCISSTLKQDIPLSSNRFIKHVY